MAKRLAVKPKRRAAKLAARHPRRTGRVVAGGPGRAALRGTKLAVRNPRATRRGARMLGRSARGGTRLWARGKTAKITGRGGAKALKAASRGRRPRSRLIATGALAALGAYFLDPRSGKRRRSMASDKAGKLARRGKSQAESKARQAQGAAAGAAQGATSSSSRPPAEARLNDPALARKVETEIFRDAEAPKGAVSVSVENGVVFLRGEVEDSSQVEKLSAEARKVEGVREVQNLLHKPGDPAPAKSDGGPGSGAA
jgi:osmotically-inducible protein OsmY